MVSFFFHAIREKGMDSKYGQNISFRHHMSGKIIKIKNMIFNAIFTEY